MGRFRNDPRELDADERAVAARQYPEGLHVLGSLLGLAIPVLAGQFVPGAPALLTSPLAAILGLLVGGVGGYLLGEGYRRRALRRRRAGSPTNGDERGGA